MRASVRTAVDRRLRAAEAVIAGRVLKRVVELLAAEWKAADWTRRQHIEAVMAKLAAGEIEGIAADPGAAVLQELAKSAPEIAMRVAAAVGVILPSPSVSPAQ